MRMVVVLAGPVRAEERKDLAGSNFEGHIVHRHDVTEALSQMLCSDHGHAHANSISAARAPCPFFGVTGSAMRGLLAAAGVGMGSYIQEEHLLRQSVQEPTPTPYYLQQRCTPDIGL